MKSMTGFGRAENKDRDYEVIVEAKTVNSKHRDVYLKIPFVLNVIDGRIRKKIQDYISRGKLDLYISFTNFKQDQQDVVLNKSLAKSYVKALNELMNIDSMIDNSIDLGLVASVPDVIKINQASIDEDELWQVVSPVLENALESLVQARQIEGNHLKEDLKSHTDKTAELVAAIKEKTPVAFETTKENLRKRVEALLENTAIDEALILNEIAILSDRLAVDEEITRLESHIQRLYDLLETEEPVGRKIDFLLQELNRETNTIGSKTDNIDIKNYVVDLKSEIEKIREQVQNIE